MDNLHLLLLSDNEDTESLTNEDLEERAQQNGKKDFREEYFGSYDDVKQPCKHIKEDW